MKREVITASLLFDFFYIESVRKFCFDDVHYKDNYLLLDFMRLVPVMYYNVELSEVFVLRYVYIFV